jgi:hypothetical protein
MVAQIPHQRSDRDVHGEPPFAPAIWQTQGFASTTWQTQVFASTTWQAQGSAPTIRHSLLATRCSLFANRQSLPFSVVADSLMADTKVCPYHSLIATRCRSSSRQSLIASRCRPRQSLIASRCLSRYSPLTTLAISPPLSGYNQASNPQAL